MSNGTVACAPFILHFLQLIEEVENRLRRRPIHVVLDDSFEVFRDAVLENLDPMHLAATATPAGQG
jgi:hypothetical protein